uniref:Thymidine kinase n=1 Tax=Sus scrofa TaxID=9823 RepID=A0A8D0SIK2_PIG
MSCINLPTVLPGSPSKTRGQIQVILGPMFSGKSTELMRRVRRFQIAQYKCLVIKYAKDTRYSSNFSTHDRNTMEALPACVLRDVAQEALGVSVIGIDEGQFFPDIVEFSETMANEGKTVIVAALDGTFQRKVRRPGLGPGRRGAGAVQRRAPGAADRVRRLQAPGSGEGQGRASVPGFRAGRQPFRERAS